MFNAKIIILDLTIDLRSTVVKIVFFKKVNNLFLKNYSSKTGNMFIILFINVKMPTNVGILTSISMINTTSERLKAKKFSFVSIIVFMSS